MKARIRCDLIIDPSETVLINQIRTFLVGNNAKFLRISTEETSSIIAEKCYHDETPPKPCEIVFEWHKE